MDRRPANLLLGITVHVGPQGFGDQLRAQADSKYRGLRVQRLLNEMDLGCHLLIVSGLGPSHDDHAVVCPEIQYVSQIAINKRNATVSQDLFEIA